MKKTNGVKRVVTKKKSSKKETENGLPKPFPIVGFGASAGGVQAFIEVLRNLDPNLGMAYVLIMHLSPSHKSALAEIMQSKTKMPVQTVKNGMEVKINNVYVIPPNTYMTLVDGHLKLAPRSLTTIGNFAVDYFFMALASIYKNNAIGVVLSGTASDGTLGLKAIKTEGGITFAQDETAEFSGMPRHADDSGFVDFRLSPEQISKELARLGKSPYTLLPLTEIEGNQLKEIDEHPDEFKKILTLIRSKSGVDFLHHYKQASIYRRVVRRMTLNKFETLAEYYSFIKSAPVEVKALYNDFLINVTGFFRDPEFYRTLDNIILPSLVKGRKEGESIRVWVAGCSTGEEAYSVAISILEFREKRKLNFRVQIFASDLDVVAIEKARLGVYPLSSLQGLSPSRLKKYFVRSGVNYQIVKLVRELCVFSQHNLLKDPPFSRVDLISCQNVLIYLEGNPQRRIFQTFHYALKPSGYLFLGKSESIGNSTDLFDSLHKKTKFFSRRATSTSHLEFTVQSNGNGLMKELPISAKSTIGGIEKYMDKVMLSQFVYPSVVVNKNFSIVQFFGLTSPYLEPVSGKASLGILKMVREDLVIDLGTMLQHARKTEKAVTKEGVLIHNKKIQHEITLQVIPKKILNGLYFLVVFKDSTIHHTKNDVGLTSKEKAGRKETRILKLEEELVLSREVIRTTNEEYETTYEELQANNEEILSSNEELQSVNEELETSKEELQSANEELTTTNAELNKRNKELSDSQRELTKVNELLEQFAFVSSHDLQEPLRKISSFSSLLSSPEADLNSFARKYSEKISVSANRMSTLIKDLLVFSTLVRVNDNKSTLTNLNEIVRVVLEDFELIIEEKKAVVRVSELPSIYAHPVQMTHLFHNLISNALKFSQGNPVISIASRDATAKDFVDYPMLAKGVLYTAISVKDNGVGFDEKYADKIFVIFQKLNDVKNVDGTGLGLALSKKIVEDHHGFIVAAGKVGEGSVFTVFLPRP